MMSTSLFSIPSSTGGNLVTIPDAISAHSMSNNAYGGRNVFVDGSWHMPMGPSPRNARCEFVSGPRVLGAVYFDIDDVSSPHPSNLPHMRPSSSIFARVMDRMGICPEDTVYVYGANGCAYAHRAYWTFAFGGYHDPSRVRLVQGSLDEWDRCGGPLDRDALIEGDGRVFRVGELNMNDDDRRPPRYVPFRMDDGNEGDRSVVDADDVLKVVDGTAADASTTLVIDARSAGRFHGREPEPRPGLRGGHIPGSINVPFISLLDPKDLTKFKSMDEVRAIFVEAGIEPLVKEVNDDVRPMRRRVICTCGSGVTAAALAVALEECGLRERGEISLFDGSWIEWGGRDDTPIATD
jgi:thiosulfate/3-mercaptopyruvate sulfurtransferase